MGKDTLSKRSSFHRLVLVVVLLVTLAQGALEATAGTAAATVAAPLLLRGALEPHPAVCRVNIKGPQQGGISNASIVCTGGQPRLQIFDNLLGKFKGAFHGVKLQQGLRNKPTDCLVTVLGGSDVVLVDSVIGGVRAGLKRILCVANSRRLQLQRSRISNNAGIGLTATGSAHVTLNGSRIDGNVVDLGGAGVHLLDGAVLLMLNGSSVSDNVASHHKGGGIRAGDSTRVLVTGRSMIANNTSIMGAGGGVVLFDRAKMTLGGCSAVSNNRARVSSGGGVAVLAEAKLLVTGASSLTANVATEHGGAVHAAGSAVVTIKDRSVLISNQAGHSGGAIYAMDTAVVTVTGQTVVANNTGNGGGGLACSNDATYIVDNGTAIGGNNPWGSFGGGLMADEQCSVSITRGVIFMFNQQGYKGVVAPNMSLGKIYIEAGSDMVLSRNAHVFMDDSIRGDEGHLSMCSHTVLNAVLSCGPGLYRDESVNACKCCPPYTYSFDVDISHHDCRPCPQFAKCPGGDAVWPIAGYWRSSQRSAQIHECLMGPAACGDRGVYEAGYQGNLCGGCASGYGMTLAFRCLKCMTPARHLGLYLSLAAITVVLVTCTVHLTWRENCQGGRHVRASDLIKVFVQFLQYLVILGSFNAPWPQLLRTLFTASTFAVGAASGQGFAPDCWTGHYLHFQQMPLAIRDQLLRFFAPVGVFLAVVVVTTVGHAVVLSFWHLARRSCCCCCCCGGNNGFAALQTVRTYTLGACILLVRRLPVIAIVVLFYAYPTLVKSALAFFACVRIDDSTKGPYAQYAIANASTGYWVLNMSQVCFRGWHRIWAFGFGLPTALLLCLAVPVWLFVFLRLNKGRLAQKAFRERYGFLYRNYSDSKDWWESVWAVQTVLLSAVTVFQFSVESYTAVLLFSVLFIGSAVLQAVVRPYAEPRLHYLQLMATALLFLTAQSTLALFHPYADGNIRAKTVPIIVGTLLVALNGAFVLYCLLLIALAALGPGSALCRVMGRWCALCRRMAQTYGRWCHRVPRVLPRGPVVTDVSSLGRIVLPAGPVQETADPAMFAVMRVGGV